jgi:hypothetical protein
MFIRHFLFTVIFVFGLIGCGESTQTAYSASDNTNKEWVNGVARDWATAFYVKDTAVAKRDFAVGKQVAFADGSIRTISRNQVNGEDLIVYLEGSPLDGKLVGYPKPIKPYVQQQ